MNTSWNNKSSLICIAIALVTFLVVQGCRQEEKERYLRVGAIVFLTGPQAASGDDVLKGLQLAAEEVNRKGGVSGRQVKLLVEDSKDSPKDAIMAFQKLMSEGVDAFVVAGDVISYTLAPFVEKEGIPMISVIAGGADIPLKSKWIFRAWISEDDMAHAIADFARDCLKLQTVSVFAINNEFGISSDRNFRKYFEATGCRVLQTGMFELQDRDVSSQIAKILALKSDGIYVTGFGDGFSAAINHLKVSNYSGSVISDITLAIDFYQQQTSKGNEGVYFVGTQVGTDSDDPQTKDFAKAFAKRFLKQPSFTSAFSYEAIRFICLASERAGFNPMQLRDGLLSLKNVPTALGLASYDDNGELQIPMVIRKMKNGTSCAVGKKE